MKIPKIIHQTWKDIHLPSGFKRLSDSWKIYHPDWEYKIWTDEMNRDFICTYFPEFIEKYDSYPSNIYRVDVVRYLILYKYGGVFSDMDFECFKNIESILEDASCVFGQEPAEHCQLHEKDMIISNAFMAIAPGHPFLQQIYKELTEFSEEIEHLNNRVLETTGPFMVTRVYHQYQKKQEVKILGSALMYPLTKNEISVLLSEKETPPDIMQKMNAAYAIHYYYGTWWDKSWCVNYL